MATAGSYLGGHLALRLGAGASHAEQVSHLAGLGWHDLCALDQLPDRRPVRRQLGYLGLLVYRHGSSVDVLSDRCSHLGGPLHQGRIVVERGTACVACPWHGSTFAIADGTVVHGPATARQPAFETRVTADGRVELRARP
jgi:nitrite reductase/ring-hydroxylating ferredoxin subunit